MLCFYISFGFPNPKKASERVGEDDLRGHLHSQNHQSLFMTLFYGDSILIEKYSLSIEIGYKVSDGKDTLLSCLYQILLAFLFALSSEAINAALETLSPH